MTSNYTKYFLKIWKNIEKHQWRPTPTPKSGYLKIPNVASHTLLFSFTLFHELSFVLIHSPLFSFVRSISFSFTPSVLLHFPSLSFVLHSPLFFFTLFHEFSFVLLHSHSPSLSFVLLNSHSFFTPLFSFVLLHSHSFFTLLCSPLFFFTLFHQFSFVLIHSLFDLFHSSSLSSVLLHFPSLSFILLCSTSFAYGLLHSISSSFILFPPLKKIHSPLFCTLLSLLSLIPSDCSCWILFLQGSSVNSRDYCGWQPIHEASNHGNKGTFLVDSVNFSFLCFLSLSLI